MNRIKQQKKKIGKCNAYDDHAPCGGSSPPLSNVTSVTITNNTSDDSYLVLFKCSSAKECVSDNGATLEAGSSSIYTITGSSDSTIENLIIKNNDTCSSGNYAIGTIIDFCAEGSNTVYTVTINSDSTVTVTS